MIKLIWAAFAASIDHCKSVSVLLNWNLTPITPTPITSDYLSFAVHSNQRN